MVEGNGDSHIVCGVEIVNPYNWQWICKLSLWKLLMSKETMVCVYAIEYYSTVSKN